MGFAQETSHFLSYADAAWLAGRLKPFFVVVKTQILETGLRNLPSDTGAIALPPCPRL